MRYGSAILALVLLGSVPALADKPDRDKGVPPGLAKKGGLPPGQAKKAVPPPGLARKGGLPPGLAKKFGSTVPSTAYIALDPRHDDRAWFLVNGRWMLRQGLTTTSAARSGSSSTVRRPRADPAAGAAAPDQRPPAGDRVRVIP